MSAEPTAYSNRACSRLTFCEPVPTQGCAVCDTASCPDCGEYMAADSVMVDDDGCNGKVRTSNMVCLPLNRCNPNQYEKNFETVARKDNCGSRLKPYYTKARECQCLTVCELPAREVMAPKIGSGDVGGGFIGDRICQCPDINDQSVFDPRAIPGDATSKRLIHETNGLGTASTNSFEYHIKGEEVKSFYPNIFWGVFDGAFAYSPALQGVNMTPRNETTKY